LPHLLFTAQEKLHIKFVSISANFRKVNFPAITAHIFMAYNGKRMFIDQEVEFYSADINNFGKTCIKLILLDVFHCLKYMWVTGRFEIWLYSPVHLTVAATRTVRPTFEMLCILNVGLLRTVDNEWPQQLKMNV
jgi:hypothetical protein